MPSPASRATDVSAGCDRASIGHVRAMPDGRGSPAAPRPPAVSSPFAPASSTKSPRNRRAAWISPQTWALAGGLLAIGLLAYYMLQPPSADALYRRVQQQTVGGSTEALEQAEDDIRRFLKRFPGDPRSHGTGRIHGTH